MRRRKEGENFRAIFLQFLVVSCLSIRWKLQNYESKQKILPGMPIEKVLSGGNATRQHKTGRPNYSTKISKNAKAKKSKNKMQLQGLFQWRNQNLVSFSIKSLILFFKE
jgi:hypothetical protein